MIAVLLSAWVVAQAPGSPVRTMAVTVDDVPVSGPRWTGNDLDLVRGLNRKMLDAFVKYDVPAIGFVNEIRLGGDGAGDGAEYWQRVDILRDWIRSGFELGNHTFSHPDLNTTPLSEYQRDVLRGERVSRALMEEAGLEYRYFRLPFTHSGPTRETRNAFREFLHNHGYVNAPFTIENVDYAFNVLLADARRSGDSARIVQVQQAYLDHTDTMAAYFAGLSMDTFAREIPQILLIHVNLVNAGVMEAMLERFRARGYRFVSLEEALEDSAYGTPDEFVGQFGPSWIHRWRVGLGLPPRRDEPDPPAWVLEEYRRITSR